MEVSQEKEIDFTRPKFSVLKNSIAGSAAGAAANLVGFPLDTIKVRLQAMPLPKPGEPWMYKNSFDCFFKIIRNEGVYYLFRGVTVPILNSIPNTTVLFSCVSFVKSYKLPVSKDPELLRSLAAGMIAGVATSFVLTPLDRVKCILQIEKAFGGSSYGGPVDCLRRIYREAGVRGVYKGISVTAMRDIPGWGAMFFTNELCHRAITGEKNHLTRHIGPGGVLVSGAIAGMAYWTAGLPADVLKTRYQTAPPGRYGRVLDVLRTLVRYEGFTALYTGFGAILIRALPVNAAFFLAYDYTARLINYAFPDL
ncbi:predicted protein [Nematostella vectensis]|uniref:Uncharacterized protein n=1 Tax=Nematostella vectensis TaxID=45351 RepID=A7RL60_NEMVE|nr:predicted protein [Nematostella vectensis]|eukprot:XP_001639869.1 predicted protein [Nematostella vectensis]